MSDEKVELSKEFLRKMHEDILDIIKRRHNNVLAKLIVLGSLFGIGGVPELPGVKFSFNAYWAVPIIVLAFDLIQLDLMYALRRISAFFILRETGAGGELEHDWEWWIHGAFYSKAAPIGPPDGTGVLRSMSSGVLRRNAAHLFFSGAIVTIVAIPAAFWFLYVGMKPCPVQSLSNTSCALLIGYIFLVAIGYGLALLWHRGRNHMLKDIVNNAIRHGPKHEAS